MGSCTLLSVCVLLGSTYLRLVSVVTTLYSCPLIQSGIDWIQSLLFRCSPVVPSLTVPHLLFGFSSDEFRCVPLVFAYIVNACKYLAWQQHNDLRFRGVAPSALHLLASLKSRLRFSLPLFFKRFVPSRRRRFFQRQWGANGVLGIVQGDAFSLHF